ncbi:MBL fold metallo-hydrolase [Rhodococcus sp. BP-252]|uniref:MBL fold metallo-hydrolase n=1 Tax=unclassified Rhodococcus (in: high G+C Gram-positive bacteria) TaxID=192944 RepID=UPI001C9B68F9|nr:MULTISPECIES: MBL fold metallo-hydrolase [unclassified Rhodococcus (in: high G+C Gram-positive bacteria)]MBY6414518.1 MBL fold metallo-hydrolase [Rhodococcus sp. BP-320]MBY6419573.1 MBL fold metallo-hydrolase [Rhodococcus sp. BP-321]MBY6424185.1 MBL fold metallo-hydrolase [Rhodococcus sp. BP-324]MBY6429520.1 MBL fold metallo-hydrolase [Rhodococcus sp. BP-323]MBY6434415.1 MBL fold metallo-hydrolase [Rhodococcus sp. BP-322]
MAPVTSPPAPDGSPSRWSPLSHVLVHGPSEALLTDPPIARAQADVLIEWLRSRKVALRYIYLTHAHFDHFGTTNYLRRTFPDAVVVASRAVLDRIARETPNGQVSQRYRAFFGSDLPPEPVTVHGTPVPGTGLELDGRRVFSVDVGHSDTDDTTVLHVPDLGLVVAGDVVYNNVHQYLGETRDGGLESWQHALDQVADLRPDIVVAGHKDPRRGDDPTTIDDTRRYLDRVAPVIDRTGDAVHFFQDVKAIDPDRVNPWAIWLGALRLFPR